MSENKAGTDKSGKDDKDQEIDGDRIAKVMARAGLCSRRDAEAWIADGRVTLNGKKLTSPAVNVGPADVVEVDGRPLPEAEKTRLFRYHKPRGLVTTAKDPEGRPTVFAALPDNLPRLISVGRLDLNSEGLLLLTNDGELARRLELPTTGWVRRYRVRVNGRVDPAILTKLANGIEIDGVRYGTIEAVLDRQQGENAWLTMSLTEGKNREIRNVCNHFGWTVNRLIRLSYGPFQLGHLEKGEVEEVPGKVLRDQLGKPGSAPPLRPHQATGGKARPPKPAQKHGKDRKNWDERPTGHQPAARGTAAGEAKAPMTSPAGSSTEAPARRLSHERRADRKHAEERQADQRWGNEARADARPATIQQAERKQSRPKPAGQRRDGPRPQVGRTETRQSDRMRNDDRRGGEKQAGMKYGDRQRRDEPRVQMGRTGTRPVDRARGDDKPENEKQAGTNQAGAKRFESKRSGNRPVDDRHPGTKHAGAKHAGGKHPQTKPFDRKRTKPDKAAEDRPVDMKRSSQPRHEQSRREPSREESSRSGQPREGQARSDSRPTGQLRLDPKRAAPTSSEQPPSGQKRPDRKPGQKPGGQKPGGPKPSGRTPSGGKRPDANRFRRS
ncbi:MAG: pseudouridine synthase [Dongiaceae bacterium]